MAPSLNHPPILVVFLTKCLKNKYEQCFPQNVQNQYENKSAYITPGYEKRRMTMAPISGAGVGDRERQKKQNGGEASHGTLITQ